MVRGPARAVLLVAALAASAPTPASSQATPPARQAAAKYAARVRAFEQFVQAEMTRHKIPGLTIGFIEDGEIWVKGFGFTDLENRVPARANSAYRLASVQKSMTAVAILQLVDSGRVDLDTEVQTYVPYFPAKRWPITIRQLLGHLGGIPHYVNRPVEQHIKERKTTREAIALFENYDLVAEPGTQYTYSSYGYNLLGAAIESVTGMSYGEYMRERVWLPAGMKDTRMDDPLALIPNRVRGYQLIEGEVRNSEFIDVSSRFAAGGARGTIVDLLRFQQALNDGRLLRPASVELMYRPMTTRNGEPTGYAMGWQVPPIQPHGVVMNDGGQQETRTFILNYAARRFAMALAMNLEADVYGPIVLRLFETVVGEKLVIGRR